MKGLRGSVRALASVAGTALGLLVALAVAPLFGPPRVPAVAAGAKAAIPIAIASTPTPVPRPFSVLATIPVGTSPNDVAIDPALHRAFVICVGTNSVSVIDERSLQQTMAIELGAAPSALAVDAETHRLFVALPALSQLAVIDAESGRAVGVAPGLPQVADIALDERAGLVYVAGNSGDKNLVEQPEIVVVATRALRVVATHPIGDPGSTLDSFAIDSEASLAFVAWAHLSTPPLFWVYDTRSWRAVGGASEATSTFAGNALGSHGVAVDPTTHTAIVTSIAHGQPVALARFDQQGPLVLTEVGGAGPGSAGATVDPHIGVAYVANSGRFTLPTGAGTVSAIDEASASVLATIPVGVEPWGVAVDPASHLVFVANQGGNSVTVIAGKRKRDGG